MYISPTLANQYSPSSNQTISTRQGNTPAAVNKQTPFSDVFAGTALWSKLGQEHDLRNATFAELKQVTEQLYAEGQITLRDYAIMTFNPQESPNPPKGNYWLTPSNANGCRDWVAEWEARAERDHRLNNRINFDSNERIINILRRLAEHYK